MININVSNELISGSYGKEQFVVSYTKERYDSMMELKTKADAANSVEEVQLILGQFADLTKENYKEVIETQCPYIVVNMKTEEFFLQNEGVVSSIPMPPALTARIIDSVEKGIDFMPLIKLWIRFLRNPKLRSLEKEEQIVFADRFANYIDKDYVNVDKVAKLMNEQGLSEDIAIKYASVKDVSITQEGLLCTHKVVDEITTKWELDENNQPKKVDRYKKTIDPDTGLVKTELPATNEERLFEPAVMGQRGDAFYCEGSNGYNEPGHFVKVGCIIRLPNWSYVNTNDNASCVAGLHVGGLAYVKGYQHTGTETLDVFLDPANIGAIADGDGAIRCLQYFVHGAWGGTNGSIYHSSKYAEKTDEEWAIMRAEVVKAFSETTKEQAVEIAEINAL